jgi:hypothetical protein
MPQWVSIAFTLLFLLWLFAVILILWRVWQKQVERLAELEQALIKSAQTAAEAAKTAAEAACMLAAQSKTTVVEVKP